jgi:hypothetical protein
LTELKNSAYDALNAVGDRSVPTVKVLSRAKIEMFADDHAPPHFHLRGPTSNALVRLDKLSVMRGTYSRRDLAEALAWAEGNLPLLYAEWSRLNER